MGRSREPSRKRRVRGSAIRVRPNNFRMYDIQVFRATCRPNDLQRRGLSVWRAAGVPWGSSRSLKVAQWRRAAVLSRSACFPGPDGTCGGSQRVTTPGAASGRSRETARTTTGQRSISSTRLDTLARLLDCFGKPVHGVHQALHYVFLQPAVASRRGGLRMMLGTMNRSRKRRTDGWSRADGRRPDYMAGHDRRTVYGYGKHDYLRVIGPAPAFGRGRRSEMTSYRQRPPS